MFQFQTGSIISSKGISLNARISKFQFQTGSIIRTRD